MTNKCMKRCVTLLLIGDIQNKTTMRYLLTLGRMVIIKKSKKKKMLEKMWRKGNTLALLVGM